MKTFPKPLSHGEEKLYLKRCKEGDQTARNMLIEHNMRLVAHVVKKYQCQEYDTEDLLSVGTIGLIKAVNTFDTDKGSRLATYAARYSCFLGQVKNGPGKCLYLNLLVRIKTEKQ